MEIGPGPSSPLPPTVADRDAEIAALQTAFDEYIASSRELEDELDAELAKMQEKLAESSSANAALIGQLESLNPQLSSLETNLSETKRKLDGESALRRQSELAQDEAEARAREAEASLESLRTENDDVHEQLAFREEEVEEMRLELEVEKERHTVELEELATQLADANKRKWADSENGTAKDDYKKQVKDHTDTISVMSEDDFVTMAVGSNDVVANGDDHEDYIKRLEDELEDVTEQLIEAETNISNMETTLSAAEKSKSDLQERSKTMESRMHELEESLERASADAENKEHKIANAAAKEELALLSEELALTQEELRAAEEDTAAATEALEKRTNAHKAELAVLKSELDMTRSNSKSTDVEIGSLQDALTEANSESATLRDEVENLMRALENAKRDHEKTVEEMEALRQAFDDAEGDVLESSMKREEELIKGHKREVQDLQAEILSLQETTTALESASSDAAPGATLQIKLDQAEKDLERAKKDLNDTRNELDSATREVAELSAGAQSPVKNSSNSPEKLTKMPRVLKPTQTRAMLERFMSVLEVESSSEFHRSHARSRTRKPRCKRARSSSPSTIDRLEHEISAETRNAKELSEAGESLKSQKRMSDVRVKHLEDDVSKLHDRLQKAEEIADNIVSKPMNPENPESRDDKDVMDSEVEELLTSNDKERIASEFRSLASRSTAQKEHNAQLLVKILKLQGNIQVCCRVRPMTNGEIKAGIKRVVEPLGESEVGCFDERTKSWRSFQFDKVWGPDSHQLGIFQDVEPLALSVVDGYNACIFAYGQTGSGKTYTMEGGEGIDRGISFRTIEKLFNITNYRTMQHAASQRKYEEGQRRVGGNTDMGTGGEFKFSINVGMLEIYNDAVYDLLVSTDKKAIGKKKKQSLEIKRNKEGHIEVAGLTKEPVKSLKDVLLLLKRGNKSRATAETDLNAHSSRSHMVLSVQITSGIEGGDLTTGNLYLVDLAGSERVRKSAVEGQGLKEASHINKSLAALGNVMEALDRKASHVPYRDSKLTYLLQDSLGGNSRTMMVVAVCPASNSFDETQHALQFATRVRRINIGSAKKNVASKNLEQTVKALSSELKMLAKAKERSEEQLVSLKRDHNRIQDRLRSSSENRAKANDEARTLTVLKSSNAQMTARWQKEKQMHEKAAAELDDVNNDLKTIQQQLSKSKRENDRLSNMVAEKEMEFDSIKTDLRKAKDESSAANLRARKAQMLQNRPSNSASEKVSHIVKPSSRNAVVTSTPRTQQADVDPTDAREKVLAMLKEHDPQKVDRIDKIMERFVGREAFLMDKMASRYNDTASQKSNGNKGGGSAAAAAQKRSEMALARHMERMRNRSQKSLGGSSRSLASK